MTPFGRHLPVEAPYQFALKRPFASSGMGGMKPQLSARRGRTVAFLRQRPCASRASSLAPTASDDAHKPAPTFDLPVSGASDGPLPVCVTGFLARRTPIVPLAQSPTSRVPLPHAFDIGHRRLDRGPLSR